MNRPFDLRSHWNTAWSGVDILVLRNDVEVDRVHAPHIERVVFFQTSAARGSSEPSCALVELANEFVVFPADTGFAGRVHFERQAFWAAKACIYWAETVSVPLPPRCLQRRGFTLMRREPCYTRVPREELKPLLERWVLEGPQSWEERRWQRGSDRLRAFPHRDVDKQPARPAPRTETP